MILGILKYISLDVKHENYSAIPDAEHKHETPVSWLAWCNTK